MPQPWIRFTVMEVPARLTKCWHVVTRSGETIGSVSWFGRWRKYAYFPINSVYEEDCLREIASFIETKTREHRAARKERHG